MLCLIIKIQDKLYALAAADVEHIYPCPYIENEKLNYHGEIIKVVDLAVCLKLRKSSSYSLNTPFIVIKSEKKFALVVDELVTVDSALEVDASQELRWQDKKCHLLNVSELYARANHEQ